MTSRRCWRWRSVSHNQTHAETLNQPCHLELEPGAAFLFSIPGERVSAGVVATFQLNGIETKPGQKVVLTGDCEELGNWDPEAGYVMEYVNQNTWICEVGFDFSVGRLIHFKYLIGDNSGSVQRENMNPRRLLLHTNGREKVDSKWQIS